MERKALTHKFNIAGHEGYITAGLYDDGSPGEIFINMSKEGSNRLGSDGRVRAGDILRLQYGVPLEVLVDSSPTPVSSRPVSPAMPRSLTQSPSPTNIFRWLAMKFLTLDQRVAAGVVAESTDSETAGPDASARSARTE